MAETNLKGHSTVAGKKNLPQSKIRLQKSAIAYSSMAAGINNSPVVALTIPRRF